MTRLSKNFTLRELTKSDTAARLGIDNTPTEEHLDNLKTLVTRVLQPTREAIGPIKVTSGYRGPKLNTKIGGSRTSDHMHGRAADIETFPDSESKMRALGKFIQDNLEFKQLIWEFGGAWIHVSYQEGRNRKQVIEAYRDENGKTKYRPFSF